MSSLALSAITHNHPTAARSYAGFSLLELLLIDDLVSLRALPSDLRTSGSGEAMIAKGQFGNLLIRGSTNTFSIEMQNVPKGACVRLAQQFTPQNANDFVSLAVDRPRSTRCPRTSRRRR